MPPKLLPQPIAVDDEAQPNHILCNSCHKFSQKSFFFTRPQSSKHQSSDQRWGELGNEKFGDIQKKQHCPVCRLVWSSLANNPTGRMPSDDDSIYYYRIPFGTYQGKHSSTQLMSVDNEINDIELQEDTDIWNLYQTNRLHVSTDSTVLDNVGSEFARFLDNGQRMGPPMVDADILLLEMDETNLEDRFLQGRRVGDQLDFDLCKSWINICTKSHGESCAPMPLHEFPRRLSRVIDVEKRMIVSPPLTCSYAPLSYRWGNGVEQLKLEKATLERLTSPGGLGDEWDDIPHTIYAAMAVCSRLSVRYLWVDALCIQQDDPEDTLDQMHIMDAIYSGGAFTIVAATGSDSWAGLPGVLNNARFSQNKEVVRGLTLSTAQPTLRSIILDSPWNSRAWTFQEAILSKRLLILTEHGTFFQCNAALWWEDTYDNTPSQNADNFDRIRTPHHVNPFWKDALPSNPDFQSYAELVQDYTRRSMTKHTDSLNAFAGLGRALEKSFGTTFFKGLPLIFFDIALCFETPFLGEAKRLSEFPSWSWCGWRVTDGVSYYLEDERVVVGRTFYRIGHNLHTDKSIIPFGAENTRGESLIIMRPETPIELPTISTTILERMSNVEHRNLLIFEALATRLFVSAEDDGNGKYMLSATASESSSGGPVEPIGYISLDPSWRRTHSREVPFDFIEICIQCINDSWRGLVILVEKDDRGISQRVQMCDLDYERWIEASPVTETVYLL